MQQRRGRRLRGAEDKRRPSGAPTPRTGSQVTRGTVLSDRAPSEMPESARGLAGKADPDSVHLGRGPESLHFY